MARTGTMIGRSLLGAGLSLAMVACASGPDLHKELAAIREELTAQRRSQDEQRRAADELKVRLEKLEARSAASRAPAKSNEAMTALHEGTESAMAALPVVKLAPREPARSVDLTMAMRAPPVDTRVPMREPKSGKPLIVVHDDAEADEPEDKSDGPVNLNAIVDRVSPAETEFAAAMESFHNGAWQKASAGFKKVSTRYPKHELAPVSTYWSGRTHQSAGKYADAIATWKGFVKENPKHELVVSALFEMAQCETKLGSPERARAWLERLVKEHPSAQESMRARTMLADLKVDG